MPAKKRMMQEDPSAAPIMPPQMSEPATAPTPKPKAKAKPKMSKMTAKAAPKSVATETATGTETVVSTKVSVLAIGAVALAAAFGLAYLGLVRNQNQFIRVDSPQINWRSGYSIYMPGYTPGYQPGYQSGYQPAPRPGYISGCLSCIKKGSLITGERLSAVYYYASNGKRYVFPNEKTYLSWFPDYSTVQTVSDANVLANILIGGNVHLRPGSGPVKISTDPSIYAVAKYGLLRKVMNDTVAAQIWGANWRNSIYVMPDVWFATYNLGPKIASVSDYNVVQQNFKPKLECEVGLLSRSQCQ